MVYPLLHPIIKRGRLFCSLLITITLFLSLSNPTRAWSNESPNLDPFALEISSSYPDSAKGFLDIMNTRISSKVETNISKSPSSFYLSSRFDQTGGFNSPLLEEYLDQERMASAKTAFQDTVLQTLNDIELVALARGYLEGLTHAQLIVSDRISFRGPSLNRSQNLASSKKPPLMQSDLSVLELPSPGLSLRTSLQQFESHLSYLPLSSFPLTLSLEHPFLLRSKIGLNYRWSTTENDLITTFFVNF